MKTEFIGKFEVTKVAIDGYLVPRVTIVPHKGAADGLVDVILDDRFAVTCDTDEAEKWLWIIANAMAIGAGYSCHGENAEKLNPHKTKITGIKP